MSIRYLLKNILNKNWKQGKGVVIHNSARIFNIQGDKDAIVIGEYSHIRGELLTFAHGGKISIGDYCFIGEYGKIWSALCINIGNHVLIGHSVSIFDNQTHSMSASSRRDHFKSIISGGHPSEINLNENQVTIEDDVWIGCQSVILRGITVGRGAIVGAGSIVTKDVPAWTIVAGNPARVIREIPVDER